MKKIEGNRDQEDCIEEILYAGKIVFLDQINGTLKLRKGKSSGEDYLPKTLSIAKQIMSNDYFMNLNNNIYNFVDSLLENNKNYKALISFLDGRILEHHLFPSFFLS